MTLEEAAGWGLSERAGRCTREDPVLPHAERPPPVHRTAASPQSEGGVSRCRDARMSARGRGGGAPIGPGPGAGGRREPAHGRAGGGAVPAAADGRGEGDGAVRHLRDASSRLISASGGCRLPASGCASTCSWRRWATRGGAMWRRSGTSGSRRGSAADRRRHGTTGEVPLERFAREAERLRPCAGRPPFGQLRDPRKNGCPGRSARRVSRIRHFSTAVDSYCPGDCRRATVLSARSGFAIGAAPAAREVALAAGAVHAARLAFGHCSCLGSPFDRGVGG